MTTSNLIQRIEEASFNAWPALNVLLYDGWLLRFANGYTKRANSVSGLYQGTLAASEKIDTCERIFIQHNLRPIFRLTPLLNRSELDALLQPRGYERIDQTSVQLLDLDLVEPVKSKRAIVLSQQEAIDHWLQLFHDLNPGRKDTVTHKLMLNNIMGSLCLMVLKVDDVVVACGLAVTDGDYVGLFDIVTAVDQRRNGYGLELTASLLAWGVEMKARCAYLQVMTRNAPALRLYSKLGFREHYQYWYRIAPGNWRNYE